MKCPGTAASFEKIETTLRRKVLGTELGVWLVALGIAAYTIAFSFFTIMKHMAFRTYAWDLGIFDQALWTTLYAGRFFFYTPELLVNLTGSFFGVHFSPILFFLLPFYALHPAPETLLVLQSLILALGAIPLYKLVTYILKFRTAALAFVSVYLLYPPLQGINWFDFHVQSFLPLFLFSAFYFLLRQKWKAYFASVVLALMCEEHVAMIVSFLGVFLAWENRSNLVSSIRDRNIGNTVLLVTGATFVLSVAWYFIAISVRSIFFPSNPTMMTVLGASRNWSVLGSRDALMIPFQIITHPVNAVQALAYDFLTKSGYMLALFLPLAFRSFGKMKYLLPTLPWFVYALFSNYPPYYTIYNQYAAYVLTFIFIATIFSCDYSEKVSFRNLKRQLLTLVVFGLAASILVSPIGPVVNILYPDYGAQTLKDHERATNEVLRYLPGNASVVTHNNLFAHVSNRVNAYAIPTIPPILDANPTTVYEFTQGLLGQVDFALMDTRSDPLSSYILLSLIAELPSFRLFVSSDGVLLFEKGFRGNATVLEPYHVRYDYRSFSLYSGELVNCPNSTSDKVVHFNGTKGSSPLFCYGPRSLLPSGKYNVTLRMKINGIGEMMTLNLCFDEGRQVLVSNTLYNWVRTVNPPWTSKTFILDLTKPIADFEIRATQLSNRTEICLDYVDVTELDQ